MSIARVRLHQLLGLLGVLVALGLPRPVAAQDRRNEQFYYPGAFNWQFLANYAEAARLFNAFDYGHAVLYEKLLTKPGNLRAELERKQFDYLTRDLLIRPPRFAIAEEVVEPSYSKLVWQAKQMFDWAHLLHRQVYDVYADERLTPATRDSLIERLTDYYLTRRDYAFRPVPKSMALMDEQYYSQVFRRGYPKFNGLIWSYHWLQVGLYEPLIAGRTRDEKKAGVQATLARFWTMMRDPPNSFPKTMPMTSAVAPRFSAAHPRAAVIFDNLHMMHDIISDILAADTVPRDRKRSVIYAALAEFRDTTRNVMTLDEWRGMGDMMGGIAAMGGPAIDLITPSPAATAPGDAMAGMSGRAMSPGAAPEPGRPASGSAMPGMAMPGMSSGMSRGTPPCSIAGNMQRLELHERMMGDPVIRGRLEADTVMRRLMAEMHDSTCSRARAKPASAAKARNPAIPRRVTPKSDSLVSKPRPMPAMPGMRHH